ncbi:anti-sigma regulatory factor [Salicibibacter cibarius]|uniref:Anti-sigma regulatory factor n=1 Tax=Salicibibacter cibarius TaxID=2743000 RepID=A0A7T7CAY5_9BACI|nr:anti-sigma regulatory factor [Salicibibacter cibarius]QQK75214.1 anti-sigma regulatory factor [Salicibibacter cibarius]
MRAQPSVEIGTEWGIVSARQAGRDLSKEVGFSNVDQARIATAISELARNIHLYAENGIIGLEVVEQGISKGVKIVASDEGPGIENLGEAMTDGYSSSNGLGAGLPGVKRLMDEFDIETEPGKGTVITAIKWLR